MTTTENLAQEYARVVALVALMEADKRIEQMEHELFADGLMTDKFAAMEEFASADSWSVRSAVAETPECPVHLLERLSQDEHRIVRAFANEALGRLIENGDHA